MGAGGGGAGSFGGFTMVFRIGDVVPGRIKSFWSSSLFASVLFSAFRRNK